MFSGDGSTLSFANIHRQHHAKCETVEDPHSPKYMDWFEITYWLSQTKINPKYIRGLLKDPWIKFTHRHYFKFNYSLFLLFVLLGEVDVYGYVFAFPIIFSQYFNSIINYGCHKRKNGYRNFNTKDDSVNCTVLMWVMYGSGLHNNHHAKPKSHRLNVKEDEFDFLGTLIEKFFMIKEK